MPLRVGFARTPQNLFSELCICAKTVVAPKMRALMPNRVGQRPASCGRELRTAVSTAEAALAPTRSLIAAEI